MAENYEGEYMNIFFVIVGWAVFALLLLAAYYGSVGPVWLWFGSLFCIISGSMSDASEKKKKEKKKSDSVSANRQRRTSTSNEETLKWERYHREMNNRRLYEQEMDEKRAGRFNCKGNHNWSRHRLPHDPEYVQLYCNWCGTTKKVKT